MVRARSRPFPAVSAGPGAPAPGSASAGEPAGPSVPLEALTRWGFPGASARGPHGQGRLVVWHLRAVRVGASLSRPAGLGSVREGWLWAKGRESEWLSVRAWVCADARAERCLWVFASRVPVRPRSAGDMAQPKVRGAKGSELSAAILQLAPAARGQLTCASGNGRREQVSNLRLLGVGVGWGWREAAGHPGEQAARRARHVGTAVGQPQRNEKEFPGDG